MSKAKRIKELEEMMSISYKTVLLLDYRIIDDILMLSNGRYKVEASEEDEKICEIKDIETNTTILKAPVIVAVEIVEEALKAIIEDTQNYY